MIYTMKRLSLLAALLIPAGLFAQLHKPPVDTTAIHAWTDARFGMISPDGQYASYTINNEPVHSSTLVVRSLTDGWEYRTLDAGNLAFTKENGLFLFQRHDSAIFLKLGTGETAAIPAIRSFQLYTRLNREYLICWRDDQSLLLRDLSTGQENTIDAVSDFSLSESAGTIFYLTKSTKSDGVRQQLLHLSIDHPIPTLIWSTADSNDQIQLGSVKWEEQTGQIAFLVSNNQKNTIWHIDTRSSRASILIDDSILQLPVNRTVDAITDPGFSHDGSQLFFSVKGRTAVTTTPLPAGVDIWNYKDEKLQSEQLDEISHHRVNDSIFIFAFDIERRRAIMLCDNGENLTIPKGTGDTLAFMVKWKKFGSAGPQRSFFFVATRTGARRAADGFLSESSPAEKYRYGYDTSYTSWYIYDPATAKRIDISACLPPAVRLQVDNDKGTRKRTALSLAAWAPEDSVVFVYDEYDIWKIDLTNHQPAINLTAGYGREHRLRLRLIGGYNGKPIIQNNGTYILSAEDAWTGDRGFYSWSPAGPHRPVKLDMGPYTYDDPYTAAWPAGFLQMHDNTRYLVQRGNATESPNYFVTSDFRTFRPLSSVYPESQFNWLTAQMVHWKAPDNTMRSGVLYKPADFDSGKQYPVIINYYEKKSQSINEYKLPQISTDNINIPWFVGRGYIVFTPDIMPYTIGHPGRSAWEAVTSGTLYITRYPWVNRARIALDGHSWGGFETDCIISHSNYLYCAAVSASGISDVLSDYSALTMRGSSLQDFVENAQPRMGSTPWDRPDLYIENSSILFANRIHAPLLLMNNHEDPIVPFTQGVELFTALRHLHHPVWMLQYDGEGHAVHGRSALDYTTRLTQFFDHYCKGAPAPEWMTVGVPAAQKGLFTGLGLDPGKEP